MKTPTLSPILISLCFAAISCRTTAPANDTSRPADAVESSDAATSDEGDEEEEGVQRNIGRFVRYELHTSDVQGAARFYSDLFGWSIEAAEDDGEGVFQIRRQGRLIGRLRAYDASRKIPEGWMSWVSVNDVDDMMRDVEANGGKILRHPWTVREERRALLVGPTGGTFGIVRADNGDGPDEDPAEGGWYWSQLWTTDFETSVNFYGVIGTYVTTVYPYQKLTYVVFENDGRRRAVVVRGPKGQPSRWLPVVRVRNVEKMVNEAQALKARVLVAPREIAGLGSIAVLQSPVGGIFGVISPTEDVSG